MHFSRREPFANGFCWDDVDQNGTKLWRVTFVKLVFFGDLIQLMVTLPETNIAPTNGWLEYYFPIGEAYFQGLR